MRKHGRINASTVQNKLAQKGRNTMAKQAHMELAGNQKSCGDSVWQSRSKEPEKRGEVRQYEYYNRE